MNLKATWHAIQRDVSQYATNNRHRSLLRVAIENLYRHPALAGIIYYRFGSWLYHNRHKPLLFVLFLLHRLFYPLVRMYSGMELSPRTQIGPGFCAMHFGPIVIHPDVVAGENLTLLHRVTLGYAKSGTPIIGNNVAIGVGATVIGGLHIGDNVSIGAGAVVTRDLPPNCTAVGIPARPIAPELHRNGSVHFQHEENFFLTPSEFAGINGD